MTINKKVNGSTLEVTLVGRLDTITAPELEQSLADETATRMVIDLTDLEYISSAGLRVLLVLHKHLMKQDGLTLLHPNEMVKEVFEITGFNTILNVEN